MSLEDLYRFAKLVKHKTSRQEVNDLFGVCERCLKDASQENISVDLRFISTYQAALAAAEALLGCMGYRAPKGNYHYMTWEALRQVLDKDARKIIVLFDNARQKRAEAFYKHADVTSEAEFNELYTETKKFIAFIRSKIKKEFPECN